MNSINPSILDYLGKWEGGILVLISLEYNNSFYEGIFYYTFDKMIINVEENLLNELKCPIELWEGYFNLMENIINMVEPYENIYDSLEEIDPTTIWN